MRGPFLFVRKSRRALGRDESAQIETRKKIETIDDGARFFFSFVKFFIFFCLCVRTLFFSALARREKSASETKRKKFFSVACLFVANRRQASSAAVAVTRARTARNPKEPIGGAKESRVAPFLRKTKKKCARNQWPPLCLKFLCHAIFSRCGGRARESEKGRGAERKKKSRDRVSAKGRPTFGVQAAAMAAAGARWRKKKMRAQEKKIFFCNGFSFAKRLEGL